jgi:hypothetical protein
MIKMISMQQADGNIQTRVIPFSSSTQDQCSAQQ